MVKNILVCLDGSAVSKCAWDQAVSDILQAGDHVEFLAVHEPIVHTMPLEGLYEMGAKANDAARNALHEAIKPYKVLAEEKGFKATVTFLEGPARQMIVDHIKKHENLNMVIMGTHGRSGLERFALGSVVDYVLRHSHVPVFAVPLPSHEHQPSAK